MSNAIPKKPQEAPMSMGEIGMSLVKGIRVRDKRFQRFWNYKPIPKLMQEGENFFSTKKPCKGIFGSNKPLAYGTMVAMADGTDRAIEEIKKGDWVFSVNSFCPVKARVKSIPYDGVDQLYRIHFEGGYVDATIDHSFPYLSNGTFKRETVGEMIYEMYREGHVLGLLKVLHCKETEFPEITAITRQSRDRCRCLEIDHPSHTFVLSSGVSTSNSTKSYVGIFEAVVCFTGIVPPALRGIYAHEKTLYDITYGEHKRPRQVRIIVMDLKKHLNETILPILIGEREGILPEAWSNWDPTSFMFKGPDGSFLSILSVDPKEKVDPNRLRGPVIDHTMIDEINQELVLTESLARSASLNDGPRTVTMCYCPQEGFECWTYKQFFNACYERKGDRTFRKPIEKCSRDVYSIQVCMKDNPSISEATYQQQCRLYKPHERAYRVDGDYSNRTANYYYDPELFINWERDERCVEGAPFIVHENEVDTETGVFKGSLERISNDDTHEGQRFDEVRFPVWRMWEKPGDGEKYVMTADLGEGNEKSDPHSIDVWRVTKPEMPVQVAHLHIRLMKPGPLAIQCACMANIFGDCLLVPESNNTGGGMFVDRIRNYVNLYKRITIGTDVEHETARLGWHTDRYTKGPMLDNSYKMLMNMGTMRIKYGVDARGKDIVRNFCPFNSQATLSEFLSYEERIEKNRDGITITEWGAKSGTHDDQVISTVIAFRIAAHEFDKISTCVLKKNVITSPTKDDHYLGKRKEGEGRTAFKDWKKQPDLNSLRRRYGESDKCQTRSWMRTKAKAPTKSNT